MARADEAGIHLHPRVEDDEIPHADAQVQRLQFRAGARIQPHLQAVLVPLHLARFPAKDVAGGLGQQDRASHLPSTPGETVQPSPSIVFQA